MATRRSRDLAHAWLMELLLPVPAGSVALLGDAIHSLSDVPTSAVEFLGSRISGARA
jgi:divalent metal cation (Fe/Co/Zn/Cd) transporter